MRSSTKSRIQFALWIVVVILAGLNRAGGIDPLWLWLGIGLLLLAQVGLWLLTRMRYVDYVIVPLRPGQMPRDLQQKSDRWTPEFLALGCRLIGDFQLSYFPWPTWVRYFVTRDQRIWGEISHSDDISAPSFSTIFEDGRAIETARLDGAGPPPASTSPVAWPRLTQDAYGAPEVDVLLGTFVGKYFDRALAHLAPKHDNPLQCREDRMLWAQNAAGLSVEQLFSLHLRIIDLYESTYGVKAIVVTASRMLDFTQYVHRLLWFQQGNLPARYGTPEPPGGARLSGQVANLGPAQPTQGDMPAGTAGPFQAEQALNLFR